MPIQFTQDKIELFSNSREDDLAKWNWNRLKNQFPELAKNYFNNDDQIGIEFLQTAQIRIKKYLEGSEDHQDYNQWRTAYGEICFILNDNKIDDDPWNRSLLEEQLWPPFLAIDILAGILESSLNAPESQKFYADLEKQKWA